MWRLNFQDFLLVLLLKDVKFKFLQQQQIQRRQFLMAAQEQQTSLHKQSRARHTIHPPNRITPRSGYRIHVDIMSVEKFS